MEVRRAKEEDMEEILRVFTVARQFMRENGNTKQWISGYPSRDLILSDIEKGDFYVCEEEGEIYGAFAMIIGEDPCYKVIYEGKWKRDCPYAAIHRIGSDGRKKGIFGAAFSYTKQWIDDIRADTHEVNLPMQRVLTAHGFEKCGIVYMQDGTPRIAFEWQASGCDGKK